RELRAEPGIREPNPVARRRAHACALELAPDDRRLLGVAREHLAQGRDQRVLVVGRLIERRRDDPHTGLAALHRRAEPGREIERLRVGAGDRDIEGLEVSLDSTRDRRALAARRLATFETRAAVYRADRAVFIGITGLVAAYRQVGLFAIATLGLRAGFGRGTSFGLRASLAGVCELVARRTVIGAGRGEGENSENDADWAIFVH